MSEECNAILRTRKDSYRIDKHSENGERKRLKNAICKSLEVHEMERKVRLVSNANEWKDLEIDRDNKWDGNKWLSHKNLEHVN